MFYLIAIVFIAELIILHNMILFLIRLDKQVCLITKNVDKSRTKLKWNMKILVEKSENFSKTFPKLLKHFEKTKKNIILKLINQSLQGAILLFFKPEYKKMFLGIKTGVGLTRKFIKV